MIRNYVIKLMTGHFRDELDEVEGRKQLTKLFETVSGYRVQLNRNSANNYLFVIARNLMYPNFPNFGKSKSQ